MTQKNSIEKLDTTTQYSTQICEPFRTLTCQEKPLKKNPHLANMSYFQEADRKLKGMAIELTQLIFPRSPFTGNTYDT